MLIEDFAAHGGHKFLFDYLLYLERKGDGDAREAVRNMVFLISGLVTAGFHPSVYESLYCFSYTLVECKNSLIWTPMGQKKVSLLVRCPHFRG